MNLEAKEERLARRPADVVREQRVRCLNDEKRIRAVTVCFTDLEGRLHMLDFDKKFLLKAADNLTFDGSSIRGIGLRVRRQPRTAPSSSSTRCQASTPALEVSASALRRRMRQLGME